MIRAEKYQQALAALHQVTIRPRFMAYQQEQPAKIAALLDATEYLVQLLAAAEDRTDTYAEVLKEISEQHPCRSIFVGFNRDPSPSPAATVAQA